MREGEEFTITPDAHDRVQALVAELTVKAEMEALRDCADNSQGRLHVDISLGQFWGQSLRLRS